MEIKSIRALRGPNQWTAMTVLEAIVIVAVDAATVTLIAWPRA